MMLMLRPPTSCCLAAALIIHFFLTYVYLFSLIYNLKPSHCRFNPNLVTGV
ncbi:hypothetical protein BDR03DRAFT_507049 [Suillus americanus]|nr:hypothetical protein BDR03DRAFT_507049 [Suillus americanus]